MCSSCYEKYRRGETVTRVSDEVIRARQKHLKETIANLPPAPAAQPAEVSEGLKEPEPPSGCICAEKDKLLAELAVLRETVAKVRNIADWMKEQAWNEGLCHDPDLDELADEVLAALSASGGEGQK
jgi:hypothetical protein